MRNLILVLGIVLLLSVTTSAQQTVSGVTGKGVKLGFGIANINTDYAELDDFLDSRVGFSGGAFLTYAINRQFAIQPELLLVTKGAEKDLFFFSAHWNLDYIELPVLLRFDLAPEGKLHPLLMAGPALDLLLSSKLHVFGDEYDVKDYTKGIDLGLVFGGGLEYKHFTFDMRYTLGLAGLIDGADDFNAATGAEPGDSYYLDGDPTVKNTDLAFMLGYKF
jgi:hypothetical protein